MTQEQQKVLEQFDNSTIYHFLREVRNIAFISWGIDDVIGTASEQGFIMEKEDAIDIIAELDRRSDCSLGITWDTINAYVDTWIEDHSFDAVIKEISTGETREAKFCSLQTNDNIEDFWNDDEYYYYGLSLEEVSNLVGKSETVGDAKIVSV